MEESSRQSSHDKPATADNGIKGQADFLASDVIFSSHKTYLPPEDTNCAICLEQCNAAATKIDEWNDDRAVVYLKPCMHFFHKNCITTWFTTTRRERDTCPNCRRTLFTPNPLTQAQIESLDLHDQELGTELFESLGHLRPNEEVILWELFVLDRLARMAVGREMAHARMTGGPHRWIRICWEIRENLLHECEGSIREIFRPHMDTFVYLVCVVPLLFWLAGHRDILENDSYHALIEWTESLKNRLGIRILVDLWSEYRRHGLLDSPTTRVQVVPRAWTMSIIRAAETSAAVQMDLEYQLEVQMQEQHQNLGVRGWMRKIARRIIPVRFQLSRRRLGRFVWADSLG